jgi:hypothetical protein
MHTAAIRACAMSVESVRIFECPSTYCLNSVHIKNADKCHDIISSCASKISSNYNYCQTHPTAFEQCHKSCNFCLDPNTATHPSGTPPTTPEPTLPCELNTSIIVLCTVMYPCNVTLYDVNFINIFTFNVIRSDHLHACKALRLLLLSMDFLFIYVNTFG